MGCGTALALVEIPTACPKAACDAICEAYVEDWSPNVVDVDMFWDIKF
jgi:hypothetical protein